jgi:hypothetical protein
MDFLMQALMIAASIDVSGRWAGTSEFTNRGGEVRSGPILMTLKQEGAAVTGTAGPSAEQQQELHKGWISGDKLTFETTDPGGKVEIALLVRDGVMKGEAKMHREYGVITMKLELKKE